MSFSALVRPLAILSSVAFAAFVGCGGEDDDPSGDDVADGGGGSSGASADAAATLQSACEGLATTGCLRFAECIDRSFLDDDYDCEPKAVADCLAQQTDVSTIAPSDVAACQQRIANSSCTQIISGTAGCTFPPGVAADGQPCRFDTDCAHSFCAKGFADCGTCAVPPAEGAACIQLGCGPERVCQGGQKCVTPKQAGEGCTAADSCLGGLTCVAGVCASPLETEGSKCDPEGKTAATCSLLKGLYCGADTKTCVRLAVAEQGAPCGFVDARAVACTISDRCEVGDGGLGGVCGPKGALGAACDDQHECSPRFACKDARCVDGNAVTCP